MTNPTPDSIAQMEKLCPRDKKIIEALNYIETVVWQHNRKHTPELASKHRENREHRYMQLRHELYDLVHDNRYEHERVAKVLNHIFTDQRLQEVAAEEETCSLRVKMDKLQEDHARLVESLVRMRKQNTCAFCNVKNQGFHSSLCPIEKALSDLHFPPSA